MVAVVEAAAQEALEATLGCGGSTGATTAGRLFVCVCGPSGLVQSCTDAVRLVKRRHRHKLVVDLHCEEPDW